MLSNFKSCCQIKANILQHAHCLTVNAKFVNAAYVHVKVSAALTTCNKLKVNLEVNSMFKTDSYVSVYEGSNMAKIIHMTNLI